MNPKIERVREDIKRTEGKLKELDEYLKSLRIREKQLCDEELIKVMRTMAGKDGDVIALLDAFQKEHEEGGAPSAKQAGGKKAEEKKAEAKKASAPVSGISGTAHMAAAGTGNGDNHENGGM